MSLLDVKELSLFLKIKPSTLYGWVSQDKIPYIKIQGLIRFPRKEIDTWLESFQKEKPKLPLPSPKRKSPTDVDVLIATAKREVYNTPQGETEPISSATKGGRNGAI